jgi:hypothetical protein
MATITSPEVDHDVCVPVQSSNAITRREAKELAVVWWDEFGCGFPIARVKMRPVHVEAVA